MSVEQKEALRESFEPLRDKFFPLIVSEQDVNGKWTVKIVGDAQEGDEAPLLKMLVDYHNTGMPVGKFACSVLFGHFIYVMRPHEKKYNMCFINKDAFEFLYHDAKEKLIQHLVQHHSPGQQYPLVSALLKGEEPLEVRKDLMKQIADFFMKKARKDYRREHAQPI